MKIKMKNEPVARIKINGLLKEAGWDLLKDIHPELLYRKLKQPY